MTLRKDDIIGRPLFTGHQPTMKMPPSRQSLLRIPCPHCGKWIPLQLEVKEVNVQIIVPNKMIKVAEKAGEAEGRR